MNAEPCACPPPYSCPRHKLTERVPKPEPQPKSRGRRRPLRQVSDKQAILDAKWAGIREATIYWLNKLDPDGAHCFECGRKAKRLDLDHVIPRGKGGHYTVSNAQLLCRDCHQEKHGKPRWTNAAS